MELARLLTQIGPTMMILTNISGIIELKFVNWTFTWLGNLNFLILFAHYCHLGLRIASLLAGQCVMMEIFSNQPVIQHR